MIPAKPSLKKVSGKGVFLKMLKQNEANRIVIPAKAK